MREHRAGKRLIALMITNQNNHSTDTPSLVKFDQKKSSGLILNNITRIMLDYYAHLTSLEFAGFIIALFRLHFQDVKTGDMRIPLPIADGRLSGLYNLPRPKIVKFLRIAKYIGVIVVAERVKNGLRVNKYYLKIPLEPEKRIERYLIRVFRNTNRLKKYNAYREKQKASLQKYLAKKTQANIEFASLAFHFRAIPCYNSRLPGGIVKIDIGYSQNRQTYPLTALTKGKVSNASKGFVPTGGQLSEGLGLSDLAKGIIKPIQEEPVFISRDFEKTRNIDRNLWQTEYDKTATDLEEFRHKLERREIDRSEYDRQLEIAKAKRAELEAQDEAIPF